MFLFSGSSCSSPASDATFLLPFSTAYTTAIPSVLPYKFSCQLPFPLKQSLPHFSLKLSKSAPLKLSVLMVLYFFILLPGLKLHCKPLSKIFLRGQGAEKSSTQFSNENRAGNWSQEKQPQPGPEGGTGNWEKWLASFSLQQEVVQGDVGSRKNPREK